MKTFISIFLYKLTGLNFLFVLFSIVLSFNSVYAVPVLFILLSNLFDILGYHFTLIRKSSQMPGQEIIKAYRINQLMFDAMLLTISGLLFGWIPSFCGAVLKLFGLQDIAYYIFLQKALPEKWHWLRWTPLGWLKKILSRTEVVLQAAAGAVAAYTILLLYFNF